MRNLAHSAERRVRELELLSAIFAAAAEVTREKQAKEKAGAITVRPDRTAPYR